MLSREQERGAIRERLAQLLSEYGRNAGESKDYLLSDPNSETYEEKVLVLTKFLTPELLEGVTELLWDYSRDWRISFVEANKDGSEMIPAAGLRISAYGSDSLNPQPTSPQDERETDSLYNALSMLLRSYGTSDAFGHGDYWILDDGWIPRSHKICIFNIEFLTPRLVEEVQQLLQRRFPACVVWFQIEIMEAGAQVPPEGIRVFADRIAHDWNRRKLRSIFKQRFPWP